RHLDRLRQEQRAALYSSARRAALVAFRIAGILALVRLAEDGHLPEHARSFAPCEADLEAALRLASTYLEHGLVLSRRMPAAAPALRKIRHSRQRAYYDALPEGPFTTTEALGVAEAEGVPVRTAQRYLKSFAEQALLENVRHGHWHKADLAEWRSGGGGGSGGSGGNQAGEGTQTAVSANNANNARTAMLPDQPHMAFFRGQRVRTPEGDGEVLQYFRDRITVRLGERAALFVPTAVTPLEEAPF
ncbi:MAG: hypothetical protein V3U27_00040, partial [Candidatus Tectomicrobia bacterium]